MPFTIGVLLAIALSATLLSLSLEAVFGPTPFFAALGQCSAILGAAGGEAGMFDVRLTLHDSTNLTLVMDGQTLCTLADKVSQYATP